VPLVTSQKTRQSINPVKGLDTGTSLKAEGVAGSQRYSLTALAGKAGTTNMQTASHTTNLRRFISSSVVGFADY
jgi:hypothetical protein